MDIDTNEHKPQAAASESRPQGGQKSPSNDGRAPQEGGKRPNHHNHHGRRRPRSGNNAAQAPGAETDAAEKTGDSRNQPRQDRPQGGRPEKDGAPRNAARDGNQKKQPRQNDRRQQDDRQNDRQNDRRGDRREGTREPSRDVSVRSQGEDAARTETRPVHQQRPPRNPQRIHHTADLPNMDNLLIDDAAEPPRAEEQPDADEIEKILAYDIFATQHAIHNAVIPDVIPEGKVVITGVRFRSGGKTYFFDPGALRCKVGDFAVVETARGMELGEICIANRMVDQSIVVPPLRPVSRIATPEDIAHNEDNHRREDEAYRIALGKIAEHKLDMKLVSAQYTFDNSKLLFYFTSAGRVDFRELVKDLAGVFHIRIELRQIGIRDEARMIGGLGACGRPLCCATFLSDFGQVSMKMAKEQNLSLNSTKISGCCGRLMCCLRFEHETYQEEIRRTPAAGSFVNTPDGVGVVTEIMPIAGEVKVKLQAQADAPAKRYKRDDVSILPRPADEADRGGRAPAAGHGDNGGRGDRKDRADRGDRENRGDRRNERGDRNDNRNDNRGDSRNDSRGDRGGNRRNSEAGRGDNEKNRRRDTESTAVEPESDEVFEAAAGETAPVQSQPVTGRDDTDTVETTAETAETAAAEAGQVPEETIDTSAAESADTPADVPAAETDGKSVPDADRENPAENA